MFMHVSIPRMGRKIPSDKMTSILPPNNFCWYPVNTEIITVIALSQFFLISLLSFRPFCFPWNPLTISSPSPILSFLNFLYSHVLSVCQIVAGKPLVVPQASLLGHFSFFFFLIHNYHNADTSQIFLYCPGYLFNSCPVYAKIGQNLHVAIQSSSN